MRLGDNFAFNAHPSELYSPVTCTPMMQENAFAPSRPAIIPSLPQQSHSCAGSGSDVSHMWWSEMMWSNLSLANGHPEARTNASVHHLLPGMVGSDGAVVSAEPSLDSFSTESTISELAKVSLKLAGYRAGNRAGEDDFLWDPSLDDEDIAGNGSVALSLPMTQPNHNSRVQSSSTISDQSTVSKPVGVLGNAPKEKGEHKDKEAKRRTRCNKCEGCLRRNCGQCPNCLDKKEFGGLGVKKQACVARKCLVMKSERNSSDSVSHKKPRTSQYAQNTGVADRAAAAVCFDNQALATSATPSPSTSSQAFDSSEDALVDHLFDDNIIVDANCSDMFDQYLDPDSVDEDASNQSSFDPLPLDTASDPDHVQGFDPLIESDILQWY